MLQHETRLSVIEESDPDIILVTAAHIQINKITSGYGIHRPVSTFLGRCYKSLEAQNHNHPSFVMGLIYDDKLFTRAYIDIFEAFLEISKEKGKLRVFLNYIFPQIASTVLKTRSSSLLVAFVVWHERRMRRELKQTVDETFLSLLHDFSQRKKIPVVVGGDFHFQFPEIGYSEIYDNRSHAFVIPAWYGETSSLLSVNYKQNISISSHVDKAVLRCDPLFTIIYLQNVSPIDHNLVLCDKTIINKIPLKIDFKLRAFDFSVLSMNTNGNGKSRTFKIIPKFGLTVSEIQRSTIQDIIVDTYPDIILVQDLKTTRYIKTLKKNFDNAQYETVHKNVEYETVQNEKEGIMFNVGKFSLTETKCFEKVIIESRDKANTLVEATIESIIDRMAHVVLRSKTIPYYDALVISWHGKHKTSTKNKEKFTSALLEASIKYAKDNDIKFIIIGGDFNMCIREAMYNRFTKLNYWQARRTSSQIDHVLVYGNIWDTKTFSIDPTDAIGSAILFFNSNIQPFTLSVEDTMCILDHDPIYTKLKLIP